MPRSNAARAAGESVVTGKAIVSIGERAPPACAAPVQNAANATADKRIEPSCLRARLIDDARPSCGAGIRWSIVAPPPAKPKRLAGAGQRKRSCSARGDGRGSDVELEVDDVA